MKTQNVTFEEKAAKFTAKIVTLIMTAGFVFVVYKAVTILQNAGLLPK